MFIKKKKREENLNWFCILFLTQQQQKKLFSLILIQVMFVCYFCNLVTLIICSHYLEFYINFFCYILL